MYAAHPTRLVLMRDSRSLTHSPVLPHIGVRCHCSTQARMMIHWTARGQTEGRIGTLGFALLEYSGLESAEGVWRECLQVQWPV